jgi:glutamyl-tRNA synthetase
MTEVRVRFAPSPTGKLHIGSMRTALFNWLFAQHHHGKLVLRIEDTDRERFVEGATEYIQEALHWYGLDFDEGPIFQSQRTDEYKKYATQLIVQGSAYYCFCTHERLEELRKVQTANRLAPRYDGHCRSLSDEEINKRFAGGEKHVIRMKVPSEGTTEFDDIIRGHVSIANKDIDDQVLIKSDGFPTYHLANVVDDHDEKISHVIRAEEWLPSTPKHLQLYLALGWTPPQYAHLSMVLGTDRSKLSKRHGATAALEYRELGYLPEAVLNFIALLGWNPKTEKEIFTLSELVKEFDLANVNKSGAIFDLTKLDWLNGVYIRNLPIAELTKASLPFLGEYAKSDNLDKIIGLFQDRLKKLSELKALISFFFEKKLDFDPNIIIPKKTTKDKIIPILELIIKHLNILKPVDFKPVQLKKSFEEFIKTNSLTNMIVLWPLRVAITGREASPGVFEIMEILGQATVIDRVENALVLLKRN